MPFITGLNQSPFDVGTRLTIDDFKQEQASELDLRYGGPLHGRSDARLLVGDSVREARVRCPFYASYLARHLG